MAAKIEYQVPRFQLQKKAGMTTGLKVGRFVKSVSKKQLGPSASQPFLWNQNYFLIPTQPEDWRFVLQTNCTRKYLGPSGREEGRGKYPH